MKDKNNNRFEKTVKHLVWFSVLFVLVLGIYIQSVAWTFPMGYSYNPRQGASALTENIGLKVLTVMEKPFKRMPHMRNFHTFIVCFCWALFLYVLSRLLNRPKWVNKS